ncbi:SDR family NAD(P)-dependent oxidoreductase [Chthonobacter albigriseus]|uniref:SDR family NAD(P)-dependent oxidoreductase n=1 Tax=Chthonobacter albigriseus TaxID=1683161 RepID=UPI0015EED154|nr:SDR family oxidoreductase [Chthonobacter albigriseus]
MTSVLITGVGRDNIGFAAARRIARDAQTLVIADVRPIPEALIAAIRGETSARIVAETVDVASAASIDRLLDVAFEAAPELDGLVNCAGIADPTPPLAITMDAWDRLMTVNLKGTFFVAQGFVQRLLDRGRGGSIVNLSSMAGRTGGKHNGLHYAASKAGVISITKGLARAFGEKGIRVNAVAPGIIDTVMSHNVKGSDDQARNSPLGRWGTIDEVGETIAFLLGPGASYVTGATLDVNGGIV